MNRKLLVLLGVACLAAPAVRADDAASGGATAQTTAQANAAATVDADTRAAMDRVKEHAHRIAATARHKADARLQATAQRVDRVNAAAQMMAQRLAGEFGGTADAMLDQQAELDASWGELWIAHTLKASAQTSLTAAQLVTLHEEGNGWGEIAAGLGLNLGDAVSAVKAESRVASGDVTADGRVAAIGGEGAHVGLGAGARVTAGGVSGAVSAGGAASGSGLGLGHLLPGKP